MTSSPLSNSWWIRPTDPLFQVDNTASAACKWVPLGLETAPGEPKMRTVERVPAIILVKTDAFAWDNGSVGNSQVLTWDTWDPEDMHWSTITCTIWAHLDVPTIAHELGQCFGLDHNGAEDGNFDGFDNSIDLIATSGSVYHTKRLKPSTRYGIIGTSGIYPSPRRCCALRR